MYKSRQDRYFLISVVVITVILTFSSSVLGFILWERIHPDGISFDTDVVKSENIKKFNSVREILNSQYFGTIDENKMLEGAISGMVESLGDRYTSYYTKDEWKAFEQDLKGSFVGVGILVNTDEDGILKVIEVFENSPASKAGMVAGDKIMKVDGVDVTKKNKDDTIRMIQGKEGTTVKITVYRESSAYLIDMNIVREKIKEQNIKYRVISNEIGYIKIAKFDSEISNYFNNALSDMLKKGIKGLIIDVRDNPGGYYHEVVDIADTLLPKCTIVYTEDKNKKQVFKYSDKNEVKLPIAVLVNGNSASASEILAGAIKDNNRGRLIGTKTFGKGLVQTSYTLSDGSGLKVTIQKYFTPSGVCIQDKGIEPDDVVNLDEKYKGLPVSQVPEKDDTQLMKAIEVIKGKI